MTKYVFAVIFSIFVAFNAAAQAQRVFRFSGTGGAITELCEVSKHPFKITAVRIRMGYVRESDDQLLTIKIMSSQFSAYAQIVYRHYIPIDGDDAGVIMDTDDNLVFVNYTPNKLILVEDDFLEITFPNNEFQPWEVVVYYEILSS